MNRGSSQFDPAALAPGADPAAGGAPARALDSGSSETSEPRRGLQARVLALLPWISLAVGVAGAFLMDRSPKRAPLFALSAIGVWVVLMLLRWLARVEHESLSPTHKRLLWVARLSSLVATQSLLQLTLFFALPFFVAAATFDPGHALFLLLLCGLCAASLWDPLTERLLHRPILGTVLPASGSFLTLTAVLPGLGMSTQMSLWLGAITASAGIPLLAYAAATPEQRLRTLLSSWLLALALPLSLWLGLARIVPAAPLRLVRAEIGTQQSGKWVSEGVTRLSQAPERLICATAISAPLGLHDRLFHVWQHDGHELARIELDIVGGRARGYRTRSRIHPSAHAAGVFRCRVQTESGQVLGTRRVVIGD